MSKRVKILVSALVVILLLTVGGTAMVMAQEEPTPTPEVEAKGLLARVTEILDIPQDDLLDAFKQAQQEMRQEAFIRALNKAVAEKGYLTQEEADEIKEWWQQKPEALGPFSRALRHFHVLKGLHWPRLHRLAD